MPGSTPGRNSSTFGGIHLGSSGFRSGSSGSSAVSVIVVELLPDAAGEGGARTRNFFIKLFAIAARSFFGRPSTNDRQTPIPGGVLFFWINDFSRGHHAPI